MTLRIQDYALIGDTRSAALVGNDGSIDWLCWPRFDSDACFAAILGDARHGHWKIAPVGTPHVRRRYREGTLLLDTELEVPEGVVRITDFMPLDDRLCALVRRVEGVRGRVPMRMELAPQLGYGDRTPWYRRIDGTVTAAAGADGLALRTDVPFEVTAKGVEAAFTLDAGRTADFALAYHPSYAKPPPPFDVSEALEKDEARWRAWSAKCRYDGPWKDAVVRSLITLKALTYSPTGGLVAAATTSLPEQPGGVRNWDYRFCWIRDATLTLTALIDAGFREEAEAWRDWLLRAVAGEPDELQIMYGVAGERRLTEVTLDWLPGHGGAGPVRIGNAASTQRQLDIYGEVMDCLYQAMRAGIDGEDDAWTLQRNMVEWLEAHWHEPDDGIWEVRGPRQQFTHSKVMAWVALDRMVKSVEAFGLAGPVDRWRAVRDRIHQEVCRSGFDPRRNAFTQAFGSQELDASLLMIPLVGFLPATDPRMLGTVEAIQRELTEDGLVHRYDTRAGTDGLPPGEGVFLACSFWLADCLGLAGRRGEAEALFERLLALRNDVGLLSEQYLPQHRELAGNLPQAFSHLSLVGTAQSLARSEGPGRRRTNS